MKNHPDKKEIIRAASGLIDNSSVMKHLESCADCMKYFQDISRVLSPSDNSLLSVPEDVEHRIINSYRNIKLNTGTYAHKGIGLLKPALASFVIIAVAAASILFYSSYYGDEDRKISFKSVYGDSFINGKLNKESLITAGDRIAAKQDSSSRLEIDKMFLIDINPETEIEIEKSCYSKKEKLSVFNFKIISGAIYAKFEKSANLKYRFKTDNAEIESIGTEFIIKYIKDVTMVEVAEGSLLITAIKSGETKTAVAGKVYRIKHNIDVSDADKTSYNNGKIYKENLIRKPDLQNNENNASITGKEFKSDAGNKQPELKENFSEDKKEIRKMMKETKKEMSREMKGNIRNEMKKEKSGFGK